MIGRRRPAVLVSAASRVRRAIIFRYSIDRNPARDGSQAVVGLYRAISPESVGP